MIGQDGEPSGPLLGEHCGPWMQLRCGSPVDILDPRPDQIVIDDVVWSLAGLPRYLAHTTPIVGYSVAQHSVHVSQILEAWGESPAVQLEGLWHDAGEAIYGDMPRPVAVALEQLGGGAAWRELKRRVDAAVRARVGLPPGEPPRAVKEADVAALVLERRDLMAPCERDWNLPSSIAERVERFAIAHPLSRAHAARFFHDRRNKLRWAVMR